MTRVGLLGLEPFLVSQVDGLDPEIEVVLLDAMDDEARDDLDLAVVLVGSEHTGAPKLIGAHPSPPVVVVHDGAGPVEPNSPGGPIGLTRPMSSPDLLEAIDRSRGVSSLRRSLRAMAIQQDDTAVADRWAAVARTVATLGVLWVATRELSGVGVTALALAAIFAVVRSLWWRLSPDVAVLDAVVVVALISLTPPSSRLTTVAVTMLAAVIALEAGYVIGFWRALAGAVVAMAALAGIWLALLDRTVNQVLDTATSALLVLTAVATGAMARRLWLDRTQSRSGELRRFRSALYDLSRRQAVVAVSFDIGTVAHDAMQRVIADVRPRSAMVLVADGPGPLQVAASHNLAAPPPVRLTWQAGTHEAARALATLTDRGSTTSPRAEKSTRRGEAPRPARSRPTDSVAHSTSSTDQDGVSVARTASTDALQDLLRRTTIDAAHRTRLTAILERMAPSLPTGRVLVQGAELDGELMGALIVVDPADTRSVARHAEETALALDSVRLFNRLRAFTRDQERARIGRSLHDGVMQTLAHVAFELDRVANDSWDESHVDHLGQLRDHVLGTVDEMRAVVNDLRTVRLDRGLPAALEAMALTLSPAGGPVIEVTVGDVGSLPGDVEEQFLRIAEEALTNAVRHSGGRNVGVSLSSANGALLLRVSDDGFGFTESRVGDTDGGVGLTSMYQRSKSIGARLDIGTGANGTIVTLRQPLGSTEVEVTHRSSTEPSTAAPRRRPWRWR